MNKPWDVVVVGGGVAGLSAAETAAECAAGKSILIVSNEDRLPYKRTKISKYVAEGFEPEQFVMRGEEWYSERSVSLRTGVSVTAVHPDLHSAVLSTGETLHWNKLIIATGVEPNLLKTDELDESEYHVVRRAADSEKLRRAVKRATAVAVVGLGVLGVEICEQLVLLGKKVSAIGKHELIMPRELNGVASAHMQRLIEEAGVDLRLREHLCGVSRHGRGRLMMRLRHSQLVVDQLVFCGGSTARLDLARSAGLATGSGIIVDRHMRTSHPDIYAAGDVAEHPGGAVTHLWHAAELQGRIAGANVVGAGGGDMDVYDLPPFRLKCEVFGHYFFSVNKPTGRETPEYSVVEDTGIPYRCFYFLYGRLRGVIMIDDGERAKTYERAVREGWDLKRIKSDLSINTPAAYE